jgi:pyruvate dehydrogenase E2 component (dihydrolipoamide acetyltransferase)
MADTYAVQALSPMRKVIATRMTEAARTIPHFRLSADIEVDALSDLRKELSLLAPSVKLSLNDLIIKACATALMDVPTINIQLAENGILQYHSADISVVIAIDGGLSTPSFAVPRGSPFQRSRASSKSW